MQYEMIGKYFLSKDVSGKKEDILDLVKQSEEEILKTVKNREEINYQSRYDLDKDNIIIIEIKSERKPCHEFFYRIHKQLADVIGKKMKVGIRELKLDKLIITFPIDRLPQDEITIPFLKRLDFLGETQCQIEFENVDKKYITNNYIERIIKLIKEKIERSYYEGKAEYHNIIFESPKSDKDPIFSGDPTQEMIERSWITPGPTKGKWIYFAPATKIFRAMERIVISELLEPLGFHEIISSNVVSGEEVWMKTGHLEGMPMEIYYVCEPVTRDPKAWEHVVDLMKITKEIPYDEYKDMLQFKPLQGLTYAQCPVIYWAFKGKTISSDAFPLLLFDRTVNSFRYESGGRHGIERVDEFHRIEVVFIGEPEKLMGLREDLIKRYTHVFNEILELEWRMAQVTPFYMQQAGDIFKDADQSTESILGTVDFEAWLPYKGPRNESEWLEFQNLSVVGEKYIKAFTIKAQKNEELWSGCTGIGLERWVAVFLAQKGLDPKNWPEKFKKYCDTIPDPIKIM